MRTYYAKCPVCGSLDHETLAPSFHVLPSPPPPSGIKGDVPIQNIVVCRECGMVFRNPYVPDLCSGHYIWDSVDIAKTRVNPTFDKRAEIVANALEQKAALRDGDLYLDVGAGPGMVPKLMARRFPGVLPVLMEPSVYSLVYAKTQIPNAVLLPSILEETDLPSESFSLISALGVDYLFRDHRRAMETILGLLTDGGVFYIERFFLDQPAFYRQPILDMDDLFGLNSMFNSWFGHEQFVEYLSEFFEVFDEITYTYDTTPEPLPRPTKLTGVFCRKRPGGERIPPVVKNRYQEHLNALRGRAPSSSIEDLRNLAQSGVKNTLICGYGPEARELATLIRDNKLFKIAGFIQVDGASAEVNALEAEFKDGVAGDEVNAVLVASTNQQENWVAALEAKGLGRIVFRCFRDAQPLFWSEGSTRVQMKAFLPAMLRQVAPANQHTRA